MKHAEMVLAAAIALGLSGCVLRGKQVQKTAAAPPAPAVKPAAPPPQPLSIHQTQAQLPEPQPISPAALATIQKPEPPPEVPQEQPARPVRRPPRPAASAPKAETPPVPAQAPPAASVSPEPEQRPAVEEFVPASESKRLQDSANARKQEVRKALEQVKSRALTREQREEIGRIESFLQLSDEAEKKSDMRQADALAERGEILMRELQSGIR
jgi:hypothetical protein